MSEAGALRQVLQRAALRHRFHRGLTGLWHGLLWGSAVWFIGLATFKLLPIPPGFIERLWPAPLGGAAIGFLAGARRRVPLALAARLLESRQNLQQRLSTALEVGDSSAPPAWARLVITDAATALRGLDLARLLPFHLPSPARWTLPLLAALVTLGFIPEYRSAAHRRSQREAELIRDTGRKVAEVIRHEIQQEDQKTESESLRRALEEAAAVGDRLAQARLTKADALQDLASAARRLEQEARPLESAATLQRLRQAARASADSRSNPPTPPDLQRQFDRLKDRAEGNPAETLDRLARQLEQARQTAAGLSASPDPSAGRGSLAQALEQLAGDAARSGLDLAGLSDALRAFQELHHDRLLRRLELVGQDLERLRETAARLAESPPELAALGRNLAEQLQRGQAGAAASTLDKMAERLQSAGLDPGQLQEILREISEAVEPAGDYGQIAERLQAASRDLSAQSPPEAGRQLAQAADELRQLARQAQNLDQLAEALSALKGAQLALANDHHWQPGACAGPACPGCPNCQGNPSGGGRSGRPGKGVGTWADDNQWLSFPETTERWDNSGITRPDLAARGHTERGEGTLSPNALPTRLRGQFSPGSMPSIPLQGVSLRGQSTAQYQQAAETAQSDAQSALNQDQIPRAYRQTVKGYFDDLR